MAAAFALATALLPAASALDVRVDPARGAPRLTVDGRPVRSRMFFGAPGTAPLAANPNWESHAFEFVARASATNGTLHFRFGQSSGEVDLDKILITDVGTGRAVLGPCDFDGEPLTFDRDWTAWPTGDQNTVGRWAVVAGAGTDGSSGLRVKLTAPRSGPWPDFHIYCHPRLKIEAGRRYRVEFRARANPARGLTVALYRPGTVFQRLGGPPDVFETQIRLAAAVGVDFVSFPIGFPWPKPGEAADWSEVDEACATVLRANPRALLLPRLGLDPPDWWRESHPEDTMQWEDGRRAKAVVASPRYRRDAAERLAAVVAHIEDKFGDRVAGYHPCGQNTGEWFYEDTWNQPLNGYAPADRDAWRLWLRGRYPNDAEFQRAWRLPDVTRAAAEVPTAAARHAAPNGILRDPGTERPLLDWAEFQQEAMADMVYDLARAVRQATQGRKLVVFFYGYVFEFGAIHNGPATAGHYALRRALDCPDIDVLCSPISYFDRGLGQSAPSMTAAESVALAGKLWLNEDDTHTYLAREEFPGVRDHAATFEQTAHLLVRNVAQEATRNFGTWWMDLGASGWFNDARFWAELERLRPLDERLLAQPTPFRPEIAAVIDERAMRQVAAGGVAVTRPGIYEARAALGRMGAPYGQYLLDDVLAGRVSARLYVFLNAWRLSRDERDALNRATRGAARIWCYAPGWYDGDQTSLDAMRDLTGFSVRSVSPPHTRALTTPEGRTHGLAQPMGTDGPVRPLFAVADASPNEVLATFEDGSPAVALRRTTHGPSLFVGVPGLTSDLVRIAARAGGVHLFSATDCAVYANGPFLAIHATQNGPLTLDCGHPGPIVDVLTGSVVGTGPKLDVQLRQGETRVFRRD
jgi:hypothetical protein